MDLKKLSGSALSFLGDAIFTLKVREYYLDQGYQTPKKLQVMCNKYNSAKGQLRVFNRLKENNFFKDDELEIFKRGRNDIHHIPKNGDLISYETASGLEAITGYLYITDKKRLEEFFEEVFKGGVNNE